MLEKTAALFKRQFDKGLFPGGQLVVRARGKELLNLALGVARGYNEGEGERVPVTQTTRFQVFSCSKPLIAVMIAALEDRGELDVTHPVSRYIPQFKGQGKDEITLLDVLTHRSGLLVHRLWLDDARWPDWDYILATLCTAEPYYRRGTLAYHPHEFGWLLGDVIKRVTGSALQENLERLLPPERMGMRFHVEPGQLGDIAYSYWLGAPVCKLGGINFVERFEERFNSAATLLSDVPGVSGLGTASDLAGFYEMLLNDGELDGARIISAETLARYVSPNVSGFDRVLRQYEVLGRGFQLGSLGTNLYGWLNSRGCFGHAGAFCNIAFADRRSDAVIAMVTNGNRGYIDAFRRLVGISSLARRELARG